MFRRPRSPDGDVVAAARRRLAALAAHHDREPAPPSAGPLRALSGAGEGAQRAVTREAEAEVPVPRHAGPRPSALGRWGLTGQHVTVVALFVVALVLAVAWWALRSVPHSQEVTLSSHQAGPSAGVAAPPSSAGSTSAAGTTIPPAVSTAGATAGARLVVDVAGRVRHPGIVELPPGSRVVDAITAAGGARPSVSLTSLNLARLLVDGEQIVVGVRVPMMGGGAPATSGVTGGGGSPPTIAPVSLNSATAEQLDTLPGIGPVTAQAILQWRSDNGAFTTVDELLEVSGIGDATLADIRPYVHV